MRWDAISITNSSFFLNKSSLYDCKLFSIAVFKMVFSIVSPMSIPKKSSKLIVFINTFHKQIIIFYIHLLKMSDHWLIQHDNIFFNGISFVGHFVDNYDHKMYGNDELDEKIIGLCSFHQYLILQTKHSILFKTLTSWETRHEFPGYVHAFFHVHPYLCLVYENSLKIVTHDCEVISLSESYANLFWFRLRKNYYYHMCPRLFSKLFQQWFQDMFQWNDFDSNLQSLLTEISLLLRTFRNWLESVLQNFFDNYGYFFFQILHSDKQKLFILTSSKILFILNFIERRVEWTHNLNRFQIHRDRTIIYGRNLFYFLVFCQFRLHSVTLYYYLINNIEQKIQLLFQHEVMFQQLYTFNVLPTCYFFEHEASHYIYLQNPSDQVRFQAILNERFKFSKMIEKYQKEVNETQKSFSLYRRVFEQAPLRNMNAQMIQKCCICYDELSNILFLPCNHFRCCYACGVNLIRCPICRASILAIRNIYF